MTAKHPKLSKPTNVDLHRNPWIGGSKGTTMAHVSPDELEDFEGVNTIEGDVANDTNAQGGIDKADVQGRRRMPPRKDRSGPLRKLNLQGKKTHEQQLRMLERKPDVPDSRQIEQELASGQQPRPVKTPRREGRQSEFTISRGGLNQESHHNKHRPH